MPLGSSSAAPVIRPGPSFFNQESFEFGFVICELLAGKSAFLFVLGERQQESRDFMLLTKRLYC